MLEYILHANPEAPESNMLNPFSPEEQDSFPTNLEDSVDVK